eukprot:CAMPEP_0173101116 /NCGR_PEP_ID=MMETSP1102-20130122/36630_1 /TAXON_ID=49646 /ORGANISM="Geminigera sp., Strain Caron Lab Isolate" /LENGTH=321 /DNA_ID=CAMNT_0013994733 /DNA_START=16 /DNA_END=979 /DNA_ORIENTATION=+
MVDFFAGARIRGKANWMMDKTHAGVGVLLDTHTQRVRVTTMKPGYPAHLCGSVACGDALVEINNRPLPDDMIQALKITTTAFSEGTPGSVLQLVSDGLDGVRRQVLLIKTDTAAFEGSIGKIDFGIILDNLFRVSVVLRGSAAALSGAIAQYDRLLSIDGVPLPPSTTQQEAQALLKRETGQRIGLLFEKAAFQPPSPDGAPGNCVLVYLVNGAVLDPARATAVQNYRRTLKLAAREARSRKSSAAPEGVPPPVFWGIAAQDTGLGRGGEKGEKEEKENPKEEEEKEKIREAENEKIWQAPVASAGTGAGVSSSASDRGKE